MTPEELTAIKERHAKATAKLREDEAAGDVIDWNFPGTSAQFSDADIDTLLAAIDERDATIAETGASCLAIIDALEWTGDGYLWNPTHGDYRERPDDAVVRAASAYRNGVAKLKADVARLTLAKVSECQHFLSAITRDETADALDAKGGE